MDDLVKSYPLGELHVVLDNLNIHKIKPPGNGSCTIHERIFITPQPMPPGGT